MDVLAPTDESQYHQVSIGLHGSLKASGTRFSFEASAHRTKHPTTSFGDCTKRAPVFEDWPWRRTPGADGEEGKLR